MDWQCKQENCRTILKIVIAKEKKTIRIIFSACRVNFQINFNVAAFILGEFIERISEMLESS